MNLREQWAYIRTAGFEGIGILLIGITIGFFIGSFWIGKDQDEMMRQMTQVVMIATGGM